MDTDRARFTGPAAEPFAVTPEPPYYSVIFTSVRQPETPGYDEMATKMLELAAAQPGFLGVESARDRLGITVSYWSDLASIKAWKAHAEHVVAQRFGRQKWYAAYRTRIAKVEREYGFDGPVAGEPAEL